MAHGFGKLTKLYGVTTYRVSPYQQNAFVNFVTDGLSNTFRRVSDKIFIVGIREYWCFTPTTDCNRDSNLFKFEFIAFLGAYCIKEWGDAEFARLQRKDPAEFANDV